MDIIKDYFGSVSEAVIKDQYVIVYEVMTSISIISTYVVESLLIMPSNQWPERCKPSSKDGAIKV